MALKEEVKKKLANVKKAIKQKNASRMNVAHVSAQAQAFIKMKTEADALATKMKEINAELKELLPLMDEVSKDDKGNTILELEEAKLIIKLESRLSTKLDQEEAIEYAKKHGLEKKLVYTEEIADMQAFEQLNLQGTISDKDFGNLVSTSETIALKISAMKASKKDKMPNVTVS